MTLPHPDQPRILVLALSGIGNLLMQTPLIARLHERLPLARVSVLVARRGTADVLAGNASVFSALLGNAKPSLRERLGMLRSIQEGKFDIGIVSYPGQLVTSSSLLFFGNVRRRLGHRYRYHWLRDTSLFLTHAIPEVRAHDVVQNLRLLEPLDIPYDVRAARYVFPLSPEEHAVAENFLEAHELTHTPLLGFHPGSHEDMMFKRWPPERWIQLGGELARAYDAKILVFGGEAEHELVRRVRDGIGDSAVAVTGPLRQSAAIARRCLLFVSNDSGLMHVAVSQNVPTFGLFGPTDETRTAPWGPYGHVIRAEGTQATYRLSGLPPGPWQTTDPSLLALDANEVLRRVTEQVPPGARYSS